MVQEMRFQQRTCRLLTAVALALASLCLAACSPKDGVAIDGSTVRIRAEKEDCSITFSTLREMPQEEIEVMLNDEPDPERVYWVAEFRHTGGHDIAALNYDLAKGGFVEKDAFTYYTKDGKVSTIMANIGSSRAYFALTPGVTLERCQFTHKGYSFTYTFDTGEWSYKEQK